ncbi:MAG: glycosyltransferase [Planctomycetota bacterium]
MKDLIGFIGGGLLLLVVACLLVPCSAALCLGLLFADGLGSVWTLLAGRATDEDAEPGRRDCTAASIMVLNWNGLSFLQKLLPSLDAAVRHHGGDHEIILVDNGSEDGSVAFVRAEHPDVKVVQHATNLGFVRGYNAAFEIATRDILVLLNNDMVVDRGFLEPLLRPFADDAVFAVSAQIFFADANKRREETGLTGASWRTGRLKFHHDPAPDQAPGLLPVLWAGGGSSAVDRRRLLRLGGFQDLYHPFYFEDTALSFEAWRRGWTVLLATDAHVVHAHRGTSGRIPRAHVERISRRNSHLFHWHNLLSRGRTVGTTLLLPLVVTRLALAGRSVAGDGSAGRTTLLSRAWQEALAVLMTVPRLPRLLAARQVSRQHARRTDDEVLSLAHSRHRWEVARGHRRDLHPTGPLNLLMLMARVPKLGVDGSWGLFQLLRELSKRHRVTVYALLESAAEEHHVNALRPHVHRLETAVLDAEPGLQDLHHRVPSRLRHDFSSPALRRFVGHALRCEEFDIVQVDYLEMAHLVQDLVRGVRAVHVCHEPLFLFYARQIQKGLFPRMQRFLQHARAVNYEARLYRKFGAVVCLSPEDADHLRTWAPGSDTRIVPLGVDTEGIAALPTSTGHKILFVGYFGHAPNIEGALWLVRRVLPLVRKQVPDAEVDLVGRRAPAAVEALAAEPGVNLRGYVEDLGECMADCALSVAPLREGAGLRSKVLEAFAYGRTMVVTPVAAAGIEARDHEHFRIAGDEQGFARAIVELLQDQDRRQQMEQAARALVEQHYTKEMVAQHYEALYREMLHAEVRP